MLRRAQLVRFACRSKGRFHSSSFVPAPRPTDHGRRRLILVTQSVGCAVLSGGLLYGARRLTSCEADPPSAKDVCRPQNRAETQRSGTRTWRRWLRIIKRCCFLWLRGIPVVAAAPWCWLFWNRGGEEWFWWLLLPTLEAYGPTAVKFAQWASTRPDILPANVCKNFARLQANVKAHSWKETARMLRNAFGESWGEVFSLDAVPIGSGCMAQVYRGKLLTSSERDTGNTPREVAVKVRHPGAMENVDLDLEVARLLVNIVEASWAAASYLAMSEALTHFEAFLRPQADLRIEASNLDTFRKNFQYEVTGRGLPVRFPEVVRPYVTEELLVETFEKATRLEDVLNSDYDPKMLEESCGKLSLDDVQGRVGKIVIDAYLKMLFSDNFVHGDMHPGNVLFKFPGVEANRSDPGQPELVLIDAGLAVRMSKKDRRNFVEVFHAIAMNDGHKVGQLMLDRSPGDPSQVIEGPAFVEEVHDLVSKLRGQGISLGKVRIGDMLGRMLTLACEHRVKLETGFVQIAMSLIVAEGVGRQLNPLTDVIVASRPLLVEAMRDRLK